MGVCEGLSCVGAVGIGMCARSGRAGEMGVKEVEQEEGGREG